MTLAPEEIRLLSKINGTAITTLPNYLFSNCNVADIVKRLISGGYLKAGDTKYNLSKLTIPELKQILKSNNLSVGGKKAELVERVISNINTSDLPPLKQYYVATAAGNEVLEKNEPLLLFYNSGVYDNIEDVLKMQEQHPEMSGAEILKTLLENRIEQETDDMLIYPLLRKLQTVYCWIGGSEKAAELNGRIERADLQFWNKFDKDREENIEKISEKMGISIDKLELIESDAYKELKAEAMESAMTDEEFNAFVEEQCSRFSQDFTRAEFRRLAANKRENYDDDVFTLQETLTLTADAMLRSEKY